jgi:hypothetical protein
MHTQARDRTKAEKEDTESSEVYPFQTRSAYTGGRLFSFKAYAPSTFLRIRDNLGLSYDMFAQVLQVCVCVSEVLICVSICRV